MDKNKIMDGYAQVVAVRYGKKLIVNVVKWDTEKEARNAVARQRRQAFDEGFELVINRARPLYLGRVVSVDWPEQKYCTFCAKWKCAECGHTVRYQNPAYEGDRTCAKCGGRMGTFVPVAHTSARLAFSHNEEPPVWNPDTGKVFPLGKVGLT